MRVLWICNIILPAIARELQLPFSNREGWLTGTYERLTKAVPLAAPSTESRMPVELGICFPWAAGRSGWAAAGSAAVVLDNGVRCYGLRENLNKPERYDPALEPQLLRILADFQPDIVHIFGTEFPHARAVVRVWDRPQRILLGIQGLCSEIARVYTEGLPSRVVRRATLRDVIKRDSLKWQQAKFYRRGGYEKEIIGQVYHITGRTGFDRKCILRINPRANYYHLNETMRECFYSGRWSAQDCEPGRIFLSQGDYPIKGFHEMLKAMPAILQINPQAHLYVAGNNIVRGQSLKDKIKISSYGKYLHELTARLHLSGRVTMLGKLDSEAMKSQFLKSSIFVCPSLIENSPNALGEAMLLGVPVVAAATGGIPDLLTDGREGLLFASGRTGDLARAVGQAWEQETARRLSAAAAKRAAQTHDREANYERLLEIYHEINLHF